MPKGVYPHITNGKGRIITWGDNISRAKKGLKFSDEHRKHISESHKGFKWSEEEKEKRRKGMLGKNKGHIMSEEQKQILSKANKGRPLSLEHRRKISLAGLGRKVSDRTKEKIRSYFTGRDRPEMKGLNNPMFTHPNSYKSKFGKVGMRQDLGHFVRSSWEANIIRVFKFLGFSYLYEPISFPLSNGTTYTPDLFLPETDEIIEVKGRMIFKSLRKINIFKREYPWFYFDLIGKRKYLEYKKEFADLIPEWEEG